MMNSNYINQSTCRKCKLCIEVCPVKAIGIDKNGFVNFIPKRKEICLECGQCMAVCTEDAIKISKYTYKDNLIKSPENYVDYQKYISFISTRRSIRNFTNDLIKREIIEKILASLNYAPYGTAPNKVEITIVNNRNKIEEALPLVEKFLDNITKWIENPISSKLIKRKKGIELFNTLKNHLYPMIKLDNYKLEYGDRITRDATALIIFHAKRDAEEHTHNGLIYAVYAMLAIHSLGLGGAMNGIIPASINRVKKVREVFGIPDENEAIISIMMGYPKYRYQKAIKREDKKVHWIE